MNKLYKGKLPEGCQYCIKGEKLVLFVTGLCSRDCFYCPISEIKKNKDDSYANERKFTKINNLIDEARRMKARGCGITGGDPLLKIDRTCKCIKILKNKFGKRFHVHLYTSLTNSFNKENLNKLEKAGLDELRIHPDIFDPKLWSKAGIAKDFKFDLGVEIPIIPDNEKNIERLIEFFKDKVKFFNLNELEISELNTKEYIKNNFKIKDRLSYAIIGSEELAKKIIKKYSNLNIHFCSASFKDNVQLGRRITRTANIVKKDFDIITRDGMLIRGAIYTNKFKKLKIFLKKFNVPSTLIFVDKKNKRILTSIKVVEELKNELKKMKFKPAIVEEYPSYDGMQVTSEYI